MNQFTISELCQLFCFVFVQTNNYLNQKFDIILFDEGDTEGYACYVKAVFDLNWNADCKFSDKTRLFLNNDSFSDWFDGLDQIDELTGKLVIDNTALPKGGAASELELTAMMSIRTDF